MATTSVNQASVTWRDRKRYYWPVALLVAVLPLLAGGLVALTGLGVFWWFGPLVVFGLIPLADTFAGRDATNPPEDAVAALEADHYYRWCTYLFVPLQYASLVFACWAWARGDLSVVEALGLAITVGCTSGIAINTAHELGHKRPAVERWLSKAALAQTCYGHFQIEHNRGHHARVSTPEDPASSRMGETLYEFLPRTVVGGLRSAWRLEREREARTGDRFWSPRNELLGSWAISIVVFATLVAVFGITILPWLAIQAVFGFSLLEVVNYIEHYGLLRSRRADGRYERCRPEHSWNANHTVSNVLLFHLQRHSDHHANPTRRYQSLRHFDDVPQLPSGYAGMILLAYVPPLWRRVMDHRVLDFYDGDLDRVNVHPRSRRRLERRHGAAAVA